MLCKLYVPILHEYTMYSQQVCYPHGLAIMTYMELPWNPFPAYIVEMNNYTVYNNHFFMMRKRIVTETSTKKHWRECKGAA